MKLQLEPECSVVPLASLHKC